MKWRYRERELVEEKMVVCESVPCCIAREGRMLNQNFDWLVVEGRGAGGGCAATVDMAAVGENESENA